MSGSEAGQGPDAGEDTATKTRPRARKATRGRFARRLAMAYLVGLLVVAFAIRFIGERWVISTIAMYLPRAGYLLPMPFVVLACLVSQEYRRAAMVSVASVLIVVFPLMGWKLFPKHGTAEKSIRLMSWNTYHGRVDNETIMKEFQEQKPDVFLSQASGHRTKEIFRADRAGYYLESDGEYFLVSKFPVVSKYLAPDFEPEGQGWVGGWIRYTLDTPLGLVDVFSIHPRSPRTGMDALRGSWLLYRLKRGHIDDPSKNIGTITNHRRRQVEGLYEAIKKAEHPVLVAGDSNLPHLSWLYAKTLGDLQDGFAVAGSGLGYTFPAKRPWMRIDRILADDHFRFLDFTTGTIVASDHHWVMSNIARKDQP